MAVMIKPYRKKELASLYNVSLHTMNAWLKRIKDLGPYTGRMYTINQVKVIFEHLGQPE